MIGICGGAAQAQVSVSDYNHATPMRTNVFGLGFAAGPATGLGLSFRHHLPSQLSYQVIGGIIKATDRLYYSFGGELQYDLSRNQDVRFYAAGGASCFYSGEHGHNDMDAPGRCGIGIGAETSMRSGFNINGEILFTYFSDGVVLPLPQIGIHYYFF